MLSLKEDPSVLFEPSSNDKLLFLLLFLPEIYQDKSTGNQIRLSKFYFDSDDEQYHCEIRKLVPRKIRM